MQGSDTINITRHKKGDFMFVISKRYVDIRSNDYLMFINDFSVF